MKTIPPADFERLKVAFRAGWNFSAEGFNAEFNYRDDMEEKLEKEFQKFIKSLPAAPQDGDAERKSPMDELVDDAIAGWRERQRDDT